MRAQRLVMKESELEKCIVKEAEDKGRMTRNVRDILSQVLLLDVSPLLVQHTSGLPSLGLRYRNNDSS